MPLPEGVKVSYIRNSVRRAAWPDIQLSPPGSGSAAERPLGIRCLGVTVQMQRCTGSGRNSGRRRKRGGPEDDAGQPVQEARRGGVGLGTTFPRGEKSVWRATEGRQREDGAVAGEGEPAPRVLAAWSRRVQNRGRTGHQNRGQRPRKALLGISQHPGVPPQEPWSLERGRHGHPGAKSGGSAAAVPGAAVRAVLGAEHAGGVSTGGADGLAADADPADAEAGGLPVRRGGPVSAAAAADLRGRRGDEDGPHAHGQIQARRMICRGGTGRDDHSRNPRNPRTRRQGPKNRGLPEIPRKSRG